MGKIARGTAHVKNVTVDPIAGLGKFVGRKTKNGALKVKGTVVHAVEAIREEEADIERTKALKEQEAEFVAEVLNETKTASFRARMAAAKAAFAAAQEEDSPEETEPATAEA